MVPGFLGATTRHPGLQRGRRRAVAVARFQGGRCPTATPQPSTSPHQICPSLCGETPLPGVIRKCVRGPASSCAIARGVCVIPNRIGFEKLPIFVTDIGNSVRRGRRLLMISCVVRGCLTMRTRLSSRYVLCLTHLTMYMHASPRQKACLRFAQSYIH